MAILLIFSSVLALAYFWWAARVWQGFKVYKKYAFAEEIPEEGISIVIPFRNEEKNLPALLSSLLKLKYIQQKVEVIFINDASTDQSAAILESWMQNSGMQTKLLQTKGAGKKAAQYEGILAARFELLACTDADCELPENWLHTINSTFKSTSTKLAFGPVLLAGSAKKLQRLEFLSLIGSTMGMLKLGWPVMGNAANMAVRKSVYLDVFASLEKRASASGDDIFLLHELAGYKNAIAVLHGPGAFVQTQPQQNLNAWLWQRMRWASKAKLYTNNTAVAVAVLVFGVNIFLLFLAVFSLANSDAAPSFWLLFAFKLLADLVLLNSFGSYFAQRIHPIYFVFQEFLNLLYIPFIGLFSQVFGYRWKGRNYN